MNLRIRGVKLKDRLLFPFHLHSYIFIYQEARVEVGYKVAQSKYSSLTLTSMFYPGIGCTIMEQTRSCTMSSVVGKFVECMLPQAECEHGDLCALDVALATVAFLCSLIIRRAR